jgi:hypothetical protein
MLNKQEMEQYNLAVSLEKKNQKISDSFVDLDESEQKTEANITPV